MPTLTSLKTAGRDAVKRSPVPLRVVRDLRMEAHLAGIRAGRRLQKSRRQDEQRLRGLRDFRLHFGCGSRILPDWVNIDGWDSPGIDFVADLRQPLPFADASCRAIFTEHVFEHIEIDARIPVLRELRRILTADGVLRIIVPDVRSFVDAYLRGDAEWFERVGMHDTSTAAAGLNGVFKDHFHRFIDDFDSLRTALTEAGFTRIERSAPRREQASGTSRSIGSRSPARCAASTSTRSPELTGPANRPGAQIRCSQPSSDASVHGTDQCDPPARHPRPRPRTAS